MTNIQMNYDVSELKEYSNEFNPKVINEMISKEILFRDIKEIEKDFKFKQIKMNDYTKPYMVEFVDINMDNDRNTILNLKVKDSAGRTCPKLVPYNKNWYVCGNSIKEFDISECDSLESISRVFENKYSGEFDFAYICVIDHNLEVVDWNYFYDWYDNQEYISKLKNEISSNYLKQ